MVVSISTFKGRLAYYVHVCDVRGTTSTDLWTCPNLVWYDVEPSWPVQWSVRLIRIRFQSNRTRDIDWCDHRWLLWLNTYCQLIFYGHLRRLGEMKERTLDIGHSSLSRHQRPRATCPLPPFNGSLITFIWLIWKCTRWKHH